MKAHRLFGWAGVFLVLSISSGAKGIEPAGLKPKAVFRTASVSANCVAFSPDATVVAVACAGCPNIRSGNVELWDVLKGERKYCLEGHRQTGALSSVAFSADGKLLASCGDDGIRLWDVGSALERPVPPGQNGGLSCLAFSRDGKSLAAGGLDSAVTVWNVETNEVTAKLEYSGKRTKETSGYAVMSVDFSRDGTLLAAGGPDGSIKLWELATGRLKAALGGRSDGCLSSVKFSPDGKLLASGSLNSVIKIWSVDTGKTKAILKGSRRPGLYGTLPVTAVSFSPDGKLLASVGGDGLDLDEWEEPPEPFFEINLWDVESGLEKAGVWGNTGQMFSVSFSPDGKFLATSDCRDFAFHEGPGTVRLWEVQAILKAAK